MSYRIYGKRTEKWYNQKDHTWNDPDKNFRPLNFYGVRVTKPDDALTFYTKEDAQEFLAKKKLAPGVKIEIRKVK